MLARKDFIKALSIEPNNKAYTYRLAQTYLPELKDWYQISNLPMKDEGTADANPSKVIELLSPSLTDMNFIVANPAALGTLGAAYLKLGKTDQALPILQDYRKLKGDDILGLRLLAQVYEKKNDAMGTSYCNQKATELSSLTALKLCQTAQALLQVKKEKFALGAVNRALEYSPGSVEARKILRKLAETNAEAEARMKELSGFSFDDLQAYKELMQSKNK